MKPFAIDHSRVLTLVVFHGGGEPGLLVGQSAGLVVETLRVRIPAGAAGEFSSLESTLLADSYSVSVLAPCYRSGT